MKKIVTAVKIIIIQIINVAIRFIVILTAEYVVKSYGKKSDIIIKPVNLNVNIMQVKSLLLILRYCIKIIDCNVITYLCRYCFQDKFSRMR